MLKFDHKGNLRLAALQSSAGKQLLQRSGRAPNDMSSIVLVEADASYIKSEAILRIAKYLELPFPMVAQLGLPFPLFFRDTVYDAVKPIPARHSILGEFDCIAQGPLKPITLLQVANSRYNIFGRSTVCRMKDADQMDRFIE